MKIKLVGGPLNGREVEVDDDAEQYKAFAWRWEWTNSEEKGVRLFALASRSRVVQRGIKWFIEKFGHHPALQTKEMPFKDKRRMK